MESPYFKLIKEYHSQGFTFCLKINWIVDAISGGTNSNGYIVQHFSRKSEPTNFIIHDIEYYEAWKIEKGYNIDRGDECDDTFSVSDTLANSLRLCFNSTGKYILSGDVFGIPKSSELYNVIDSWSVDAVPQANGLRSSYNKPDGIEEYYIFTRPQFVHEWSLLSMQEIEDKLFITLLSYCPNHHSRDIELAHNFLNIVFEGTNEFSEEMKHRIFMKWENAFL